MNWLARMANEAGLRHLWRVWLVGILVPLPAIAFWRSSEGRTLALGLFFVGCASLVASAFRRENVPEAADNVIDARQAWRKRMVTLTVTLFSAFLIFSLLLLTLAGAHDFVAVLLAGLLLLPSLCIVPQLTLMTGKPLAGVVFTLLAVFGMKLLGCIVVVLVYGWDASEHGHTTMPWTQPNLLVWLFWSFSGILCLSFYVLGAKRFTRVYGDVMRGV